jgi:glycosyltransferase involved in cell wall biosynthesis
LLALGALIGIGRSSAVYGANVANDNFVKALLKYSSFEEIDLFYDSSSLIHAEEELKDLIKRDGNASKLKLRNIIDLPSSFQKTDFLAFHQGNPFFGRIPRLIGERPIPITGTAHAISYHFVLNELLFNVLNARPFDSIVCTSLSQKKAMEELLKLISEGLDRIGAKAEYRGRLDLIPLGVDTSLYKPRDKLDSRSQAELPQEKLLILWIGRFSAYDKADLFPLLLVFKRLVERHKDLILVLAGDDKYGYSKKAKVFADEIGISDRLVIKTDPPFSSLPLLFSASDIFVAPSDSVQETFGLVVVEAMASGLPVVASDWNGYRDLVIHGETGFRVPTYWAKCDSAICSTASISSWLIDHLYLGQSICVDLGMMERYLLALIENPDLRAKMGGRGREHVVANYDWRVVVGRYEELWRDLKREAEGSKRGIGMGPLFEPQYFRTFRHYPTEILDETSEIRLTEEGKKLISGESKTFEFYAEMKALLDPEAMEEIAARISEADGWVKVGEISKEIEGTYGIPSEMAIYQMMWMMKYGILEPRKEAD